MGIYGNKILLEKDKDEPNRGMSGHVYKNKNDENYSKAQQAFSDYYDKNNLGKTYEKINNMNAKAAGGDQAGAQAIASTLTQDEIEKATNAEVGAYALIDNLSTTSQGKDLIDSKMQARIESFDKKKAEEILKAKDIVKEYNLFVDAEVDKIIASANDDEPQYDQGNIQLIIQTFAAVEEEGGLSKQDLHDYIKGKYFYTSDNPNNIKSLLNLRIHYCEHITKLLQEMVRINYQILGYSEKELSVILDAIGNNDKITIETIRDRIANNEDIKVDSNGVLDLTKLGGGKIYTNTSSDQKFVGLLTSLKKAAKGEEPTNKDQAVDNMLQKSFKYKAIIMCHGNTTNGASLKDYFGNKNPADMPEAKSFVTLCQSAGISKDQINKYYEEDNDEIWTIQPIKIGGTEQIITDWAIADIYVKSNKKENTILVQSCNPGAHKIHPVFHKIKGLRVTYSNSSNLHEENIDTYDSVETSINEHEWDLMNFAESCGIDYSSLRTDDIELDESMLLNDIDSLVIEDADPYIDEFDQLLEQVIQEGKITDAIKTLAKNAVEMVIRFFKRLWEIVKGVFQKIKDFFTGKDSKDAKLEKPMKVPIITSEGAATKDFEVSNKAELEKVALDNIHKLEDEISKRQKEQTDATNKLNEFVQKQAS